MPRRYFNVESKPLVELRPGERVVVVKSAVSVVHNGSAVIVSWDDGSVTTGQVAQNPGLDVIVPTSTEKKSDEDA